MHATSIARWDAQSEEAAVELLASEGHLIVSPTKVGYILAATDGAGLERKFAAKQRKRTKPGVVLCSSLEQLAELAELNDEVAELYRVHWDQDILLGCILPWRPDALASFPDSVARDLATDLRQTSCFVIRFGRPTENIARRLWEDHRRLMFASSANPSGMGNRGVVEGIGDRIRDEADLIIEADEYVRSIQPDTEARHEQGVMVSFVDAEGKLVPVQRRQRSITPAPAMIRGGLQQDEIMANLAGIFPSWDFRHGDYY
ncbi:YrdC-like domain-containing protein OS=Tsukamurella paurometabola (strain ATCC 8368 / DSM /CCUG 35730 / CIP 100753 / JCM 10117 / KCTC 9821 / NBRC 16120/ NCIMB 702349 / NCTC 13040) OX=521096 GN=Tpau_1551 PE=4 SV=1 [Tsukamurella paurometabola]|uniref:YrdC-like domain-containing protein n=1 Tax=Tsukamurella paurometabola (strain ATCC 8368 / DSM 20162 / CCUG 35730 / CIP 100753 / JCM 10117 / KCTC 9821 / NBRC 16120 / NCIMB 702349 / NCTC 13040) TaxID=521096 RepID=D5UY66_TSUPD|nr:Sua5/YciO/YrdC/YwlC family protein [Tsukamurella paurometabola]ADG78173.1 conserved hypothetical protein [Tsukamurella paurometabola DSM 20162]SUP30534.1 Putative translation factor (SUA5) [Tsukamurella paurometabola]